MPPILHQLIDRVGGRQRALMLGAGLAAALLIFALSRWATRPDWVPLYTGLPLETVGTVTQKLEEAQIPFRLENGGGELRVPATSLAQARVLLAKEGLPETGRPGLELFDQPSWGMTDFSQRINYRRALEGELERTIGKMRGVESAQVHLALQETRSFRTPDRPAEASVVLRLRSGQAPPADVVQGIAHLVASSVDGLESERVAVLDDSGRLLSLPSEPGSPATLTSRQLELQREVEAHLEDKAQQLLGQMVGAGNARVQVAANINFDRVERTVETVDPEKQAITTEQTAEIVPGPEGGAGSSNTATSYENSRSLETFAGATGTVKRLSVAVLVNERNTGSAGKPKYEPRTPEELARIEALVRSAVGVDEARGDAINVVSVAFDGMGAAPAAEPESVWTLLQTFQRPLLTVLALFLVFIIALRVIRSLKPAPAETALALAAGDGSGAATGAAAAGATLPAGAAPAEDEGEIDPALEHLLAPRRKLRAIPTETLLPAGNPLREAVVASVNEAPDVAARLVRAWLREE